MKKRQQGSRYVTDKMDKEELLAHYTSLYNFWKSVGSHKEIVIYFLKMKELEDD